MPSPKMIRPNNRPLALRWVPPVGVLCVTGSAAFGAQSHLRRFTQPIPGTSVTFEMVRVPAGEFTVGSPTTDPNREQDEGPTRTVRLNAFWMGVHEVTHDEFAVFRFRRLDSDSTAVTGHELDVDAITRPSPPYEDPAHGMGQGKHPATGMTQWAALQYAQWLSLKTGRLYRLPTEIEWEYACRAGGALPQVDDQSWYADNSAGTFHTVGQKSPNAWGLHDLLGNVAEWTLDQYDATFYERIQSDAEGLIWNRPTRTHPRTVRGGSFEDDVTALRCANREESTLRWKRRDPQLPRSVWWNTDSPHVGFRLVSPDVEMTLDEILAYWNEFFAGA